MVVAVRAEALITAQNRLRPGLTGAARELDRFRAQQTKATSAFGSTAARALAGIGAGYAAMNGARQAFQSSLALEKKMYDVQRATDTSGAALKAQEQVILDLARSTGKTKEELAGLYAAAGFAGRPTRDLARFTEYAAKATVAWGTSAESTGQYLAEIGNIYGANQRRIEQIGDAINTMADASASKETDLLDFLKRVGGQAKILGISAENVLAFGAALKEVGVQSEVAATGFQSAIMSKALVPDDDFDETLTKAGISAKKFRKVVEKDATKGILVLLEGLDKLQGTKKLTVLKDLFGLEYADDIARLTGALPRLITLLKMAGDKKAYLGSVEKGAAIALEKDFNKIERATQSLDVLMVRVGDKLKEIGGGFAEIINKAVDSSEKASKRLDALKNTEDQADTLAGRPPKPPPTVSEDPLSDPVMNKRAQDSIADPRTSEDSLHGLALYGGTDEIKASAEAEYRRRRLARASREGMDREKALSDTVGLLTAKTLLAGPDNIHADRISGGMAEMERIRLGRLGLELNDMRVTGTAAPAAKKAKVGLDSYDRLGSFGSMPLTLGKGKAAKNYEAPKIDIPGFDGAKSQVGEIAEGIFALGPAAQKAGSAIRDGIESGVSGIGARARDAAAVDLTQEGRAAGSQYVDALNAELARGIAEATSQIARLKALLNFTASPTVRVNVSGTSGGGFDTGRQGPN